MYTYMPSADTSNIQMWFLLQMLYMNDRRKLFFLSIFLFLSLRNVLCTTFMSVERATPFHKLYYHMTSLLFSGKRHVIKII